MTISNDRREIYPNMTDAEVEAVDGAFDAAKEVIRRAGFRAMGDDRAENLVGAIARFLEDSKR